MPGEKEQKPEKKFVELLAPERLPELSRLLGVSPTRLAATAKIIERLAKSTGLNFGFEIPEAFSGYDPSAWEAILTIEKLKRMGWVEMSYPFMRPYGDEPRLLQYIVINKGLGLESGHSGGGADFFSKEKALWAAVGEATERHTLYYYKPDWWLDAPYADVKNRAIDLNTIAGVDREHSPVPHIQFDNSSTFRWIKGKSLVNNTEVLFPLQLVATDGATESGRPYNRNEPLLRLPLSTGAAAHTDPRKAMLTGTLELLERDAFMITWMNMLSPDRIKLESIPSEKLQKVLADFKKYNLNVTLLHLPTDFDIHVVLAVVTDPTGVGPALNVGASAGFNLAGAAEKALSEVFTCRYFLKHLQKTSPTLELVESKNINRDGRLLYWADPAHISQASFLFAGEEKDFASFPRYQEDSPQQAFDSLAQQFKIKELELLSLPLLSLATQKELGFTVLQIVAPALQPLHLFEGFPYNWGGRLDIVPNLRGYLAAKVKNKNPHPFP